MVYRRFLRNTLGCDCNESFNAFEESVYPVDYNEESLKKLSPDNLSKSFDDELIFDNQIIKLFGFSSRHWKLFILGENSD